MKTIATSLLTLLLALTPCFAETLTVDWPDNPAQEQVSLYRIFIATNSDTGHTLLATSPTSSYTLTAAPGARYFFKIGAVNFAGNGPLSASAGTPTAPTIPLGMSHVLSGNDITLTWNANPAGEQVSSYKVWVATNSTSSFSLFTTVTTTNHATTLAPNFVYAFKVSAVNFAGESAQSAFTQTLGLPTFPQTPTISIAP